LQTSAPPGRAKDLPDLEALEKTSDQGRGGDAVDADSRGEMVDVDVLLYSDRGEAFDDFRRGE
jgi:hypothetical protein